MIEPTIAECEMLFTCLGLVDPPWSRCAIHIDPSLSKKWEGVAESLDLRSKSKTADGSSAECVKATDGCAALWLRNDDNTSTVLLQGVWGFGRPTRRWCFRLLRSERRRLRGKPLHR